MATRTPAKKKTAPPAVADLAPTPALDTDSDDIQLPRLRVATYSSGVVENELVKPGQIFAAASADDEDPVVVYDAKPDSEGLLIHVLGLVKGKSSDASGELERWAFNDPDAPPEAWTTYDFIVVLPEVDPDVPHKFLMTKSGKSTAQKIITALKKKEAAGPSYLSAFRITTAKRENEKGKWFVPQVRNVEPTDEGIQAGSALASIVASQAPQLTAGTPRSDEPAI